MWLCDRVSVRRFVNLGAGNQRQLKLMIQKIFPTKATTTTSTKCFGFIAALCLTVSYFHFRSHTRTAEARHRTASEEAGTTARDPGEST